MAAALELKMIFVISTGRSGTKFMAELLSRLPRCTCLHEPEPQLILEASGYRYGTVSESQLARVLKETRVAKDPGSIYCESNQTLSLIVPVLARVFPEARYIWLLRNGLDFVASAYQKQWYTGHSENYQRYEDSPLIEKMWIDGRIQGDLCGDVDSTRWQDMGRFAKCCWYWRYINLTIEEDLKQHCPDRFFLLRIEEVESEFDRLARWMGFDRFELPKVKRTNIAKKVPYHWTAWTQRDWEDFEYWCGELMDRFYPGWRVCNDERSKTFIRPAVTGLKQKIEELSDSLEKHKKKVQEQGERLSEFREYIKGCETKLKEALEELIRVRAENEALRVELLNIKNSRIWKVGAWLKGKKEKFLRLIK